MIISTTDARRVVRYLSDAAGFYTSRCTMPSELDRARLMRRLASKVQRKLEK